MRAQEFINYLRTQGRYSFSIQEAEIALSLNKIATINALRRLHLKKLIVSPARGFYLIIPPEYQAFDCLPAEMFIADLMQYFEAPYYIGFLSAAQYYGAAHQKPQRFQIVTLRNRPPIHCGRTYIEFIANKKMTDMPSKKFNTATGTINVATPEVLASDIVSMPKHAAGINNVTTILLELTEQLDIQKLIEIATIKHELFWLQRLGYLLEFLNFSDFSNAIYEFLSNKKLHWCKLVARSSYEPLKRDNKWKIIINSKVEPDE